MAVRVTCRPTSNAWSLGFLCATLVWLSLSVMEEITQHNEGPVFIFWLWRVRSCATVFVRVRAGASELRLTFSRHRCFLNPQLINKTWIKAVPAALSASDAAFTRDALPISARYVFSRSVGVPEV